MKLFDMIEVCAECGFRGSDWDVDKALESSKGKKVLMLVKSGDDQRYITLPRDQG